MQVPADPDQTVDIRSYDFLGGRLSRKRERLSELRRLHLDRPCVGCKSHHRSRADWAEEAKRVSAR